MQKKQWNGIPTEYTDRWREIYNNVTPGEGVHLSTACPVCVFLKSFRATGLRNPTLVTSSGFPPCQQTQNHSRKFTHESFKNSAISL